LECSDHAANTKKSIRNLQEKPGFLSMAVGEGGPAESRRQVTGEIAARLIIPPGKTH
jgi:hypothetical protein